MDTKVIQKDELLICVQDLLTVVLSSFLLHCNLIQKRFEIH